VREKLRELDLFVPDFGDPPDGTREILIQGAAYGIEFQANFLDAMLGCGP
jgi:hypothetical protein